MSEYTILVVDDEPIIRDGLNTSVPWGKCGFRLIGSASNGSEAMEVIRQERPDAVVTDIKMPIVDGLELLSWIRRMAPETQVILLSGFDDFEYARAGLRLGAFAYVLKIELKRELPRVLRDLRSRLDSDESVRVKRAVSDLSVTDRELRRLEAGLSAGVSLAGFTSAFAALHAPSDGMEPAELVQEASAAGFLCHLRSSGLIVALVQGTNQAELTVRADLLMKTWQRPADGLRCGVGLPFDDLSTAADAYRSAVKALDLAIHENVEEPCEYRLIESRLVLGLRLGEWRHIGLSVLMGQPETVRHDLAAQAEAAIYAKDMGATDVRLAAEASVALVAESLPSDAGELRTRVSRIASEAASHELVSTLCAWLAEELVALGSAIAAFRSSPQGSRIERALVLISRNYMTDLLLEDAAAYACMSPSYFAASFRRFVGKNYTTYLRELRMQEAARLLSESALQLREVAAAVGYTDVKYFMRVFKRYAGVTPGEYRSHRARE